MKRLRLVQVMLSIGVLAVAGAAYQAVCGEPPAADPVAAPAAAGPGASQPAPLTLNLGKQVTLALVLIPAGKFPMGSPDGEADRAADEGPPHEVAISRPFYLGVHEVTQRQYEQVMGKNPSRHKGPDNPVESVAWAEAQEFCRKAADLSGRALRLPTEAEWEYACRAGAAGRFSCGGDGKALDDCAWHKGNSEKKPHPVGGKKPNAFGLYDMHGNVFEWCADWHGPYSVGGGADPRGPETGKARVVRGGGYFSHAGMVRSAVRFKGPPSCRACHIGFRVAADAQAPPAAR
jgi:formylglycine-generating enzyme required for sulfatase activity